MKNLTYLEIEYFKWYRDIVYVKNDAECLLQAESLNAVEKRYKEYIQNFDSNNLLKIAESHFDKNHPELTGCYKSKTKKVSELLALIREAQTTETKSKCQYCGINKPRTIDHYLPISLYPEFAVLAINLLPCCNECNKKKDNYWKAGSFRGILNFYVDNIPDTQFLYGEVIMENELPVIELKFDFTFVSQDISKIIKAHYKRLDLFKRYEEESADEISEITRQLKIYVADLTKVGIKNLLSKDAQDLKSIYGKNYWKAILREALSNSDSFLNQYETISSV